MSKKFFGILTAALILFGAVAFFGSTAGGGTLWEISRGGTFLPVLVGISALVDSVNPCAFSILILTIAFLMSLGKSRSNILVTGGFYVAGIFAAYVGIGLGILQALHFFGTPHFMAKIGAGLLIVLGGINVIEEFFPNFPIKLRIPRGAHSTMARLMEKASLPTVFILGAFVGLCEFPCTGGPYLMVLGLLHDQANYLRGLLYLLYYNLVFILPLVVILLLASEQSLLGKLQAWKTKESRSMRLWGGIAMVVLGILIYLL